MSKAPVIHWFRRDLRMRDNMALHQACKGDQPVIPLFVIDTDLLTSERIGAPRLRFLLDALRSLDEKLQDYGTGLLVRHGQPETIIPELVAETGAEGLYFNRDYSPYACQRDEGIEQILDIEVSVHEDAILMPPNSILKKDGTPYTVYTYFWKKWKIAQKPEISVRHFRDVWFYDLGDLQK